MATLSLARKTKAELIEEVEKLERRVRALATDLDKQDVARADADRLQHLYDQSPIAIWDEDWSGIRPTVEEIRLQPIKDLKGYFKSRPEYVRWLAGQTLLLEFNQATVDLYRARNRDAYWARASDKFLTPEEYDAFCEMLAAFTRGDRSVTVECWKRAFDGEWVYVRDTIAIPTAQCEDWSCVRHTVEDHTARKRTEDALKESDARLTSLMDNAPVDIFLKDLDGNYKHANSAHRQRGELRDGGEFGKRRCDTRSAGELRDPEAIRRRVIETERQVHWEERFECGGIEHTNLLVEFPILDCDGTLIGTGAIGTDVTERRQAEAAMREREIELNSVIENSPNAVSMKDREGRFRLVNKMFREWYGVTGEEVLGRKSTDLFPSPLADRLVAHDDEALATMTVVRREYEIPFADGTAHLIEATKFPVLDSQGTFLGTATINTDIAGHRRVEDQLRQSQKMDAIGQLTSGISHDFNNILAIVQGNLELIEGSLDEADERHGFARTALDATGRAATLTHRLLAVSRKQPLKPRATDLNAEIAIIIDLLRPTLGETVDLEINLAAGLRPALVDPSQFENGLVNLAVNARDAMPAGGSLRIETENAIIDADRAARDPDMAAGRYALLSVTDTGIGMPADVLSRAFDPFFSTKGTGKGSGLGLSMVYGFAKQSGGHVEIESRPGHGTTVRLYLPIVRAGAGVDKAERRHEDMPRGGGETILIVEDDAAVRAVVNRSLEDLGYVTIEAADGEAALAALRGNSGVAAILTDLVLPGNLGGDDVARLAHLDHPGLKILFMSGYGQVDGDDAETPGSHVVKKPFRIAELAKKLRAVLDD